MPAIFVPLLTTAAAAGNGANFVTYDHHTGNAGETEITLSLDSGRSRESGRYVAQLLEFEKALTGTWVVAAYIESHAQTGDDWIADGFRFETRYRLFDNSTFLNPAVYVEYINKREGAMSLREATGRRDATASADEVPGSDARESELETRLILGHDFSNDVRLGLDWISEINLRTGDWAFGYAAGLTITAYEDAAAKGHDWAIAEIQFGTELFGGIGDSVKGLTFDGRQTEHYAGASLKAEFGNGAFLKLGGTIGLTGVSRDFLVRAAAGWEFD